MALARCRLLVYEASKTGSSKMDFSLAIVSIRLQVVAPPLCIIKSTSNKKPEAFSVVVITN